MLDWQRHCEAIFLLGVFTLPALVLPFAVVSLARPVLGWIAGKEYGELVIAGATLIILSSLYLGCHRGSLRLKRLQYCGVDKMVHANESECSSFEKLNTRPDWDLYKDALSSFSLLVLIFGVLGLVGTGLHVGLGWLADKEYGELMVAGAILAPLIVMYWMAYLISPMEWTSRSGQAAARLQD